MANFLEKLKKGMEINELPEELKEDTNKKDGSVSQTFEINANADDEKSETNEEKPKKTRKKKTKNEEPAKNSPEENIAPIAKLISKKIEIKTEKTEIEKEAP
jgi:hypothetical protein